MPLSRTQSLPNDLHSSVTPVVQPVADKSFMSTWGWPVAGAAFAGGVGTGILGAKLFDWWTSAHGDHHASTTTSADDGHRDRSSGLIDVMHPGQEIAEHQAQVDPAGNYLLSNSDSLHCC